MQLLLEFNSRIPRVVHDNELHTTVFTMWGLSHSYRWKHPFTHSPIYSLSLSLTHTHTHTHTHTQSYGADEKFAIAVSSLQRHFSQHSFRRSGRRLHRSSSVSGGDSSFTRQDSKRRKVSLHKSISQFSLRSQVSQVNLHRQVSQFSLYKQASVISMSNSGFTDSKSPLKMISSKKQQEDWDKEIPKVG